MAASYVADLRTHQPRGPYLLSGYCFGGVVAYEMARQLEAQNESVTLLALINCSPPNTSYNQPRDHSLGWQFKFLRNLIYCLGCFCFTWSFRERREFLRWKFSALRKRLFGAGVQGGNEPALTDLDELLRLSDYSSQQRDLWQAHVRMLVAYRPQPYRGTITLFRTRGHGLFTSFDNHYGWGELARGGVVTRILPGGHGDILDEPHVKSVASAFAQRLRETAPTPETKAGEGAP
jgi:thioesterase domain-containing protein